MLLSCNCVLAHMTHRCSFVIWRIIHGCVCIWNLCSSVQLAISQESAANEWDLELNTRREIPYLQATIKRLESASAIRFKMKKNFGIPITKTNNGLNFQYTEFSAIDFILTARQNILRYTAKIGLWQISSCQFSFSAARNIITKARNETFGCSFRILVLFRPCSKF